MPHTQTQPVSDGFKFPCTLWKGSQRSRYFPIACREDHGGADMCTVACGGHHAGAGGYALKALLPVGRSYCHRPILKDCGPWRAHMLELAKSMRRNKWQRGTVVD